MPIAEIVGGVGSAVVTAFGAVKYAINKYNELPPSEKKMVIEAARNSPCGSAAETALKCCITPPDPNDLLLEEFISDAVRNVEQAQAALAAAHSAREEAAQQLETTIRRLNSMYVYTETDDNSSPSLKSISAANKLKALQISTLHIKTEAEHGAENALHAAQAALWTIKHEHVEALKPQIMIREGAEGKKGKTSNDDDGATTDEETPDSCYSLVNHENFRPKEYGKAAVPGVKEGAEEGARTKAHKAKNYLQQEVNSHKLAEEKPAPAAGPWDRFGNSQREVHEQHMLARNEMERWRAAQEEWEAEERKDDILAEYKDSLEEHNGMAIGLMVPPNTQNVMPPPPTHVPAPTLALRRQSDGSTDSFYSAAEAARPAENNTLQNPTDQQSLGQHLNNLSQYLFNYGGHNWEEGSDGSI